MKKEKPIILATNDDGVDAPGIRALVESVAAFGEVIVVAPEEPQSGMGHAITIRDALRLDEVNYFADLGIKAYSCKGTPADCVKIAKYFILKNKKPDLVVSGINHGSNSSISVLYSGTMSAAIEGAIEGIPAIGFSLCDYSHQADFSHCVPFVKKIVKESLEKGIPEGVTLNVNFPKKSGNDLQGIRICRQARAKWQEEFDRRLDPTGRQYFWLTGEFVNLDKGEDTDEWALANNYVSVVPCTFDLTSLHAITHLNNSWEI
jgi:5'-nucleotidase